MDEREVRCPACGGDAWYRYGHSHSGAARQICLLCNRQYTLERTRRERPDRPRCPVCGDPMHVYRRQAALIRYRCRNYPRCRQYVKMEACRGVE